MNHENGSWFNAYRKGIGESSVNVIVVYSAKELDAFLVATDLCMRLNVSHKSDRIEIFKAIRGNTVRNEWAMKVGNHPTPVPVLTNDEYPF